MNVSQTLPVAVLLKLFLISCVFSLGAGHNVLKDSKNSSVVLQANATSVPSSRSEFERENSIQLVNFGLHSLLAIPWGNTADRHPLTFIAQPVPSLSADSASTHLSASKSNQSSSTKPNETPVTSKLSTLDNANRSNFSETTKTPNSENCTLISCFLDDLEKENSETNNPPISSSNALKTTTPSQLKTTNSTETKTHLVKALIVNVTDDSNKSGSNQRNTSKSATFPNCNHTGSPSPLSTKPLKSTIKTANLKNSATTLEVSTIQTTPFSVQTLSETNVSTKMAIQTDKSTKKAQHVNATNCFETGATVEHIATNFSCASAGLPKSNATESAEKAVKHPHSNNDSKFSWTTSGSELTFTTSKSGLNILLSTNPQLESTTLTQREAHEQAIENDKIFYDLTPSEQEKKTTTAAKSTQTRQPPVIPDGFAFIEAIQNCSPDDCSSRGRCLGTRGAPMCICLSGFTGSRCQEGGRVGIITDNTHSLDSCDSAIHCHGHGWCIGSATQFSCICHIGYDGPLCERRHYKYK